MYIRTCTVVDSSRYGYVILSSSYVPQSLLFVHFLLYMYSFLLSFLCNDLLSSTLCLSSLEAWEREGVTCHVLCRVGCLLWCWKKQRQVWMYVHTTVHVLSTRIYTFMKTAILSWLQNDGNREFSKDQLSPEDDYKASGQNVGESCFSLSWSLENPLFPSCTHLHVHVAV